MILRDWLRKAAATLRTAGRDAPGLAAALLAGQVLRLDRLGLVLADQRELSPEEARLLDALLERRKTGEPLAYILGWRAFYGRSFAVSPATLIPRPETEHLVEAALCLFPATDSLRFADCGTGSGCIAVTLAAERPAWIGLAVDLSGDALRVARSNALAHGTRDRLAFVRADMHTPVFRQASLDLLISNPPYVSSGEYVVLDEEVRREPPGALVPLSLTRRSDQGLESLERLIRRAREAVKPGGWIVLEHGSGQAEAVRLCLLRNNWENIGLERDLAGLNRLVYARRPVA